MPENTPYPGESQQNFKRRQALQKLRHGVRKRSRGKSPQELYKRLGERFEGLGEDPSRRQRARVGALGGAYRQAFLKSRPEGAEKARGRLYQDIEGFKPGVVKQFGQRSQQDEGFRASEQGQKMQALVRAIRARRAEFQAQGPKSKRTQRMFRPKRKKRPTGGTQVPGPNVPSPNDV